jgi:maleylacetate reductase
MSYFQASFDARSAAVRVRFGPGVRHQLADEIGQLGCRRALILSTPPQADSAMEMAADLKGMAAGVFTRAAMHTPGRRHRRGHGARSLGRCRLRGRTWRGINHGLGKAIAYRTDLPQIVIPTTYAGSEATWILGQTENGEKTTVTDPKIQPEVILYDAELVRTLPVR